MGEKTYDFWKKEKEIPFLYELKESLVTDTEMEYLECIESILPEGYLVLPQANLAAFITRTDQARYRGELFRNIDFIVTDLDYCPVFLIEINDQTHLAQERRERDRKVADISERFVLGLFKLLFAKKSALWARVISS